jgi:hypothetical protein
MTNEKLHALLHPALGPDTGRAIADILLPAGLRAAPEGRVNRAEFAFAMTAALHWGLIANVPTGAAYVADSRAAGRPILLDHGALRTIMLPGGAPTGAIPAGAAAFARILEPTGYKVADHYPLERLKMTGVVFCHADCPDAIAQFFVSELYVDRFSPAFAAAAERVFGTTRDPLDAGAKALLAALGEAGEAPLEDAAAAMPAIVGAFGRHHDVPALADYATLKNESAEAAWIATEGNAFNHGTDRVADVEAVAEAQRTLGRAMKDRVEVSGSGRVRQTAFRADQVERQFVGDDGAIVTLAVPGSFYEFIARDVDPATGTLDLRFDSGNAQGIFKMTAALDA